MAWGLDTSPEALPPSLRIGAPHAKTEYMREGASSAQELRLEDSVKGFTEIQ